MKKSITRLKLTLDTPEKKQLYKEIIEQPNLVSPYKKLAKLLIEGRDYEGAIKVLKVDAELHPDDKSVLEDLSRAYVAAGKTGAAEKTLKGMIKRWPSSHAPYSILVKMYRDMGKPEKAIEFLQSIPPKSPLKEISHEKLYIILFVLEDHERGVRNLEKAIKSFGKNFRRCKDLGKLLSKCGKKKDAIKWYNEAMKRKPDNVHTVLDTIMLMGLAYLDMGDWKNAEKQYLNILKIKRNSYPGLINLAELKLIQDKLDEAEKLLRKIQKLDPNDSRSKVGLAELFVKRNEPEKAIDIGLLGLRQTPFYYANELLRASEIMANAYRGIGDDENAQLFSWMNREIARVGDPFDAIMSMANDLLEGGEQETAIKLLDILLSIYMGNSLIQVKMAGVYFESGDYAKAIRRCRAAIKEKEPKFMKDRIAAHELLAKIYDKQKKVEKAKAERKTAKELTKYHNKS